MNYFNNVINPEKHFGDFLFDISKEIFDYEFMQEKYKDIIKWGNLSINSIKKSKNGIKMETAINREIDNQQ